MSRAAPKDRTEALERQARDEGWIELTVLLCRGWAAMARPEDVQRVADLIAANRTED